MLNESDRITSHPLVHRPNKSEPLDPESRA